MTVRHEKTNEAIQFAILLGVIIEVVQFDLILRYALPVLLVDEFHVLFIRHLHLSCNGNVQLRPGTGKKTDPSCRWNVFRRLDRDLHRTSECLIPMQHFIEFIIDLLYTRKPVDGDDVTL